VLESVILLYDFKRTRVFGSAEHGKYQVEEHPMTIRGRYSVPSVYYCITPLFILLDYAGGLSIRVAVLDSMPLYKNLYYGFSDQAAELI